MLDFLKIDTQEKAYLLGFISADGYIGKSMYLHINLSYKDHDHLVKISKTLDCGKEPRIKKAKYKIKSGETRTTQASRISICNKNLCNQLQSYGIISAKSLVFRPPHHLPEDMIHHYVRGYFDGDGYIGVIEPERLSSLSVQITGTSWINEWISGQFRSIYPNEAEVKQDKYCNCTRLKFGGSTAQNFCRWIYRDSIIHLERKYEIAKPFIGTTNILISERPWLISEEYVLLSNLYTDMDKLVSLIPNKTRKAIYNKKSRYIVSKNLSIP